jgi:hypothetical protein
MNIWDRNTFVQTFACAEFEAIVITSIEHDDLTELRPKEGAVSEDAATDYWIASITALAYKSLRNQRRILPEINKARFLHPEIIMMDKRIMSKTHAPRNAIY